MQQNITSHNQSGGVTAHTISTNNNTINQKKSPKPESKTKYILIFAAIGTIIGTIIALLTYLKISP